MWHVTCDMWHVTHGGGWTLPQNFSSLALTAWYLWCLEDWEEKDDRLTDSINYEAVYRTAPATPGLLNIACNGTRCNRGLVGQIQISMKRKTQRRPWCPGFMGRDKNNIEVREVRYVENFFLMYQKKKTPYWGCLWATQDCIKYERGAQTAQSKNLSG